MRSARTAVVVVLMILCSLMSVPREASATGSLTYWFVKNTSDQWNSRLYSCTTDWTWCPVNVRAGSGRNMNECQTSSMPPVDNGGWIPNGVWTVQFYAPNYNGQIIKGPAVRLIDRQCYNGTWRTEIFIHSAFPWSSGQYKSQGCIKVSSTGTAGNAGGDIRTVYDWGASDQTQHVYVA